MIGRRIGKMQLALVSQFRRHLSAIVTPAFAMLAIPALAHAQSEAVEYYGLDALGSVRVVFDANGNVLGRTDYEPFGQELTPTTGRQQAIYAGLFVDDASGFEHAQARSYQSRTGRFGSADPFYGGIFEPQRWNRYSYAHNNPGAFADPGGLNEAIKVEVHGCQDNPYSSVCTLQAWMDWWWEAGSWAGGSGSSNESYSPDYGNVGGGSGLPTNSPSVPTDTSDPAPSPIPAPTPPSPPAPSPAPPPTRNSPTSCFVRGVAAGAVTGALIAGGVIVAGTLGAPAAAVTGVLGAVAVVGGVAVAVDSYLQWQSGNNSALAYNMGSMVGGAGVGYFTGGSMANSIKSGASRGWSLARDVANRWRPSMGPPVGWLSTGPDAAAAGGSVAAGGGGIGPLTRGGCG